MIIFEDDQPVLRLLELTISRLGHETLAFSDPLACPLYWDDSCRCRQEFPCGDLLITDNRMPRMTGLEFIRRQQERGCKGVAANKAILSGAWTEGQLLEAESLSCKVFTKPLAMEGLAAWVREREGSIRPGRILADLPPPESC